MGLRDLVDCLRDTAISTGMIFMILIGAETFNSFMALSGVPQHLADVIGNSGLAPMAILILILLVYLVLGCLMDSLSMIILTLPIFLPAITGLDFGLTAEQRSEEHTSELQSLMRISYAVFCLTKKIINTHDNMQHNT